MVLRLLDCDYVYDGYGWPKLIDVQVPSRLEKIWILLCDFYYLVVEIGGSRLFYRVGWDAAVIGGLE